VGAAILSAAGRDAAAQTKSTTKELTTRSGVYNAAQAERGKNVYAGYCRSCHTAESHTGATFVATWKGRPLSDLFAFMQEKMPKNEPGSLSDREYVDVMTYVLKMNKMPAGKTELPIDTTALGRIRIQFPKTTVGKEK
jgi:mono/diheme cytochrome c family protein